MLLSLSCTCHLPAGVQERIETPELSSPEEETGLDYPIRSMEQTQDLNLTILLPWLHEQNIYDILFDKSRDTQASEPPMRTHESKMWSMIWN